MAREKTFRFKQFSVLNDKSAMKVGTDGVLLGAWCDVSCSKKVLDVGTGTGLIALMVAQRSDAEIIGIEIEHDATCEAEYNFSVSPWRERLSVNEIDFNGFVDTCNEKFDTIVSNPPYFVNSLECPDEKRMQARHTCKLTYEQLLTGAKHLLSENGHICLITPVEAEQDICDITKLIELRVNKKVYVKSVVDGVDKRILWQISEKGDSCLVETFAIEKSRHVYTDEYIALTRDFYLKM